MEKRPQDRTVTSSHPVACGERAGDGDVRLRGQRRDGRRGGCVDGGDGSPRLCVIGQECGIVDSKGIRASVEGWRDSLSEKESGGPER